MATDKDILQDAQDAFAECEAAESENRQAARDDIKFARLGEQWDPELLKKRKADGRPTLTINRLPPFIRQVVNDARQNMPAIKVMPQDSQGDVATAEVISGIIRNIEASSDADVAYDTALESAATSRAIRHGGRILIDLIPKVYGEDRVVRILGEGKTPDTAQQVKIGSPEQAKQFAQAQQMAQQAGQPSPIDRIYALGVGRYDLTVATGPSFTTRREEAANQMIELMRANPAVAPVIGDLLAKNLDWPGADEIARRLQAMLPPQIKGQDPAAAQMQAQFQQQTAMLQAELKATQDKLAAASSDQAYNMRKLEIEGFKAETDRMEAEAKIALDQHNAAVKTLQALTPPANDPPPTFGAA